MKVNKECKCFSILEKEQKMVHVMELLVDEMVKIYAQMDKMLLKIHTVEAEKDGK